MVNSLAGSVFNGGIWLLPLAQEAAPPPGIGSMMPMVMVTLVLAYFLLIRPQNRQAKEHQSMLDAIKKGDQVVTSGGLIGSVEAIDTGKQQLSVTIAPKVTVRISRERIVSVVSKKKSGKDSDEPQETTPENKTEPAGENPKKKKGKNKK